jgi:hypothetical protein
MKSLIEKLRELRGRLAGKLGAVAGVAAAIALALATPTPARAQVPLSISLLNDGIANITVSNTIPYTNILSPSSFGTNIVGLQWQTSSGSNIVVTATNGTTTRLTRSASLWADSTGYCPTNANFSLTYTAGAGNNGGTNWIEFVPVYDGTNESTEALDSWRWIFLGAGATTNTIHTNNPLSRWPGAQRFRVKDIVSPTNAAASQLTILGLKLNGFPR